ncbi:hypothetical protein [uncultured Varibaculum sp.]|uniref:antitoxin VbhA family protein n=1 Tax=uncultured Varibaculum sp. TaxID=413896 RepID=UPI0027D992E3|nr:hypothetical protein [uncultured Varibaculum sp.]
MQLTRRGNVTRAIHSAELEDQTVSSDFLDAANEYIKGTINADELVERTKNRIMKRGAANPTK